LEQAQMSFDNYWRQEMKGDNFLIMVLVVFLTGFLFLGCDTNVSVSDDIIGFYCSGGIQGMYDELAERRNSPSANISKSLYRSVVSLEDIRTDYKSARVDKYIDDYTGYPDHHHISNRDWTGVEEGFVKLDWHGFNGDGWYIWVFISIQNGDHYVIYANNDHSEEFEIGVHEVTGDGNPPGQVYFYRWE
jgi:hypothetical protein